MVAKLGQSGQFLLVGETVDEGVVAAAEVADAVVGRVDVEEAVVPPDGAMILVVRQPRRAVAGPAGTQVVRSAKTNF
jgi:hypothetical protein